MTDALQKVHRPIGFFGLLFISTGSILASADVCRFNLQSLHRDDDTISATGTLCVMTSRDSRSPKQHRDTSDRPTHERRRPFQDWRRWLSTEKFQQFEKKNQLRGGSLGEFLALAAPSDDTKIASAFKPDAIEDQSRLILEKLHTTHRVFRSKSAGPTPRLQPSRRPTLASTAMRQKPDSQRAA